MTIDANLITGFTLGISVGVMLGIVLGILIGYLAWKAPTEPEPPHA